MSFAATCMPSTKLSFTGHCYSSIYMEQNWCQPSSSLMHVSLTYHEMQGDTGDVSTRTFSLSSDCI